MATFIWVSIIIISLFLVFCLYACIYVGSKSKTDEEIEYEKVEEIEYVKKSLEAKKLRKKNKKNNYKDKKQKDVIYL